MIKINITKHNATAWDEESIEESPWCTPVSEEIIKDAKNGNIKLRLTPNKFVPKGWLEELKERKFYASALAEDSRHL